MKRKRSLFDGDGDGKDFAFKKMEREVSLDNVPVKDLDHRFTHTADHLKRAAHEMFRQTNWHHELRVADIRSYGGTKDKTSNGRTFSDCIRPWTDPQNSVNRVLEHLKLGRGLDEVLLQDSVNKKFLRFHDDITEECRPEDKQHSWAVIEKPEEIVMYGPCYPNYNNGEHSEDVIVKQTQELLESEDVSEDWCVYIFTLNSPCLARNIGPCMLNLVQKTSEWYTQYGIRSNIGYRKCWGFKGTKENLFRDINYAQIQCIVSSHNYENYQSRIQERPENNLVFDDIIFSAIKKWLGQEKVNLKFPLNGTSSQLDVKMSFKHMFNISESEDKRDILTQGVTTMLEGLPASLLEETTSLKEYLRKGQEFALDYTFNQQLCGNVCASLRLTFQQCWKDMVQDKYAEFLRERLTEDFNKCTVQLFVNDVTALSREYIEIGQIKFADDD